MATEKELRNTIATWGNAYKGIAEGSTAHKELINIFNNSGLCTRYKMTVNDAWCAMFVSDAFIANDMTSIFPCVECGCSNMVTLAQNNGIWVESDSYVPDIGDVVLYDWDDSGSGDNTGVPDHVGIVQTVSGSSFTVIEGNKSDTVGIRTMSVNGRYIRGFITPNYTKPASGDTSTSTPTTTTKTVDEIAQEVIAGQWGNDPARSESLTAAGYDAAAVQARVNELMSSGSGTSATKDSSGVAYASKQEKGCGAGVKYKVTAVNGLNLRYGPSTSKYDVIKTLPCGTYVMYYGYYDKDSNGDKWLLVMADSVTGWVHSGYLA